MIKRKKYFYISGAVLVLVGFLTAMTLWINNPTEEKRVQPQVKDSAEKEAAVEIEKEAETAAIKRTDEEAKLEPKPEPKKEAADEKQADDLTFEKIEDANLDEKSIPKAKNKEDSARNQIEALLAKYLKIYGDGNVEQLEQVVHPTSPFYEMQYIAMEALNEQGITMELVNYKITDTQAFDGQTYTVDVEETFKVKNATTKEEIKNQKTKYSLQLIDGDFYIIEGSE